MRFQVLTAASMMFRIVFWDVHGGTPQKTILNRDVNRSTTMLRKFICSAEGL
jgi:hypothetical protein